MLFNNTMKWIESFVPVDTELVKGSEKAAEGSEKAAEGNSKRAAATPLSSKSPTIVHYKIYKEGRKSFFKIIRANANEHVTTNSNDPLLSGDDRLKLTELIELCTQLQSRVLALETTKSNQALKIGSLKRRVKKLEKKVSLGDQEDASKQRRMIDDLDVDKGVTLVDETQRRNDQDMFDSSILDNENVVTEKEGSTADPVPTTGEVVTTTGGETSKMKAKKIVIQEQSETSTPILIDSSQQSSKAKDKGKDKMIKTKQPSKRKDQIMIDEEVAKNLEAQMQAELEEEERLSRQKEEETNIALIES
nr:hypothetical protein [Tanacetum cinerariifolium]